MSVKTSKGQCFCGGVSFEIDDVSGKLYQCHCSECRKVTGGASNSSLLVPEKSFRWLEGENTIRRFTAPSGYRSHFCAVCGSPVPNRLFDSPVMWVPAGLLDGDLPLEIGAHLYLDSKASWDVVSPAGVEYGTTPGLDCLLKELKVN